MLFNSYFFILVFLPVVVAGFFLLGRSGRATWALLWLIGASLLFYGLRNPWFVTVLIGSILLNYCWGIAVGRGSKTLLAIGIAANLGLLGYFKYANFFVDNLTVATGFSFELSPVVLPLAISFYTFQQISYLVDIYHGKIRGYDFLHYCLFVTFFPRLIQGPIVYYDEFTPQFAEKEVFRFNPRMVAAGITIFFFGLFKKVIFADGLAIYATPMFEAARQGYVLSCLEAWEGALAYTLQIYFDFSGYSDMAIGLAFLFGIRIPLNFNSPYRSLNVIDFWRRWHMSLSRFLRDYLYIPLGGNRKGEAMRFVNILITMLLGGLWHGAAWTFVLWGGLHGLFLIINHGWVKIKRRFGYEGKGGRIGRFFSGALTFLAVTVAWVFFRADSAATAWRIIGSMAGQNGFALPEKYLDKFSVLAVPLQALGVDFHSMHYFKGSNEVVYIIMGLLVVWLVPNVQQIMDLCMPYLNTMAKGKKLASPPACLTWCPSYLWAIVLVLCAVVSVLSMSRASEFLYFQF